MNFIEKSNSENSLNERKEIKREIISLIFYLFLESNNLQADFYNNNEEFFHIDQQFELFIEDDRFQNLGSAILFEASKIVESILKILDEKDLLFNYLPLFKSNISLDFSGKPCYDFNEPWNFSSMKNYLKKPIFSYFIIYKKTDNFKEYPYNLLNCLSHKANLQETSRNKRTKCFTCPLQLNNFCFIDSITFEYLKNKEFKIPYAMGFIIHEVLHLYTGETIKYLVGSYFYKLRSPNIDSINNVEKGESGDLLEYYITPVLILYF